MDHKASDTVGFVGLGSIGRPLVESLLRAGVPTVVNDVNPTVVDELVVLGAVPAPALADLATHARLVSICVPADEHVRAVLDGPDGVLAHLAPGSTVAIHSTVMPDTIFWAADAAEARGIRLVEAALTGGPTAAAEGRSTMLLGGADADLAALAPLLSVCTETTVHTGPLGTANKVKLCLNLQTYVAIAGAGEAARLATTLGVGLESLTEAMRANGQLSPSIEGYLTLHHLSDDDRRAVAALLGGHVAIIEKDLRLMAELAATVDQDIPFADLTAAQIPTTFFQPRPPA